MNRICYKFVTSLIFKRNTSNLREKFSSTTAEGGVVVGILEKFWQKLTVLERSHIFFRHWRSFKQLTIYFLHFFKKQCNKLKATNANPVTNCNKLKCSPEFVTICYTLLQEIHVTNFLSLQFVTPLHS